MAYAKEIERQDSGAETDSLDELERFRALHTKTHPSVVQGSLSVPFLELAVKQGLYLYVTEKVDAQPSLLNSMREYSRYALRFCVLD